jgi:hypothetical protein
MLGHSILRRDLGGVAPMLITVARLDDDGRYETRITRDDGVIYSLQGVGHNFELPHDVKHFVVESALRLPTGFWGSVANGAVFPTMRHESGRRRPKATERSKVILKANARKLAQAEVLVSLFNSTIEQGHPETSPVLVKRLKERWCEGRPLSPSLQALIPAVYSAYREIQSRWKNTPIGGRLRLEWKAPHSARALPR